MTSSQAGAARRKKPEMDFSTVESVMETLRSQDYIADRTLATTLFLSIKLEKPLFLEGEAGV
ncbi:MAG: hypothetical protein AABZ64_09345, partial [Nitrospinota bacterium]